MGGCYRDYSSSPARSACEEEVGLQGRIKKQFKKFLQTGKREEIVSAQRDFMAENKFGFIAEFAKLLGIKNVENIPKEFPDTEYEVKFDVATKTESQQKETKEPDLVEFMDAFDFPASRTARFLKDPVNAIATGTNGFYGTDDDEKLVVIRKGNGIFLKEKGPVLPISLNPRVAGQEIVIKRTEKRYPAELDEVLDKVEQICEQQGVKYRGRIKKEKGDFFILDATDGRIYSASFTRAHLTKPQEKEESGVQRQLELEYAGYLPGFLGFEKGEKPIVKGMVDLARYTFALYYDTPITRGWRMNLSLTGERKYDFITGTNGKPLESRLQEILAIPATTLREVHAR